MKEGQRDRGTKGQRETNASSAKTEAPLAEVGQNLFNYAIERDELKPILQSLPAESKIDPVAMEYEIQILKIVSVGWGIAYFSPDAARKEALAQAYWNIVQQFSGNISAMSSASAGKDIDYFNVLKDRLDIYVKALNVFSDVDDPGPVIGHTYAKLCGDEEDMYVMIAGKRVFHLSLAAVKGYLESVEMV